MKRYLTIQMWWGEYRLNRKTAHFRLPPLASNVAFGRIVRVFSNRAFSHDVTAITMVFQNKATAVMMVHQTNPPGIELYFCANTLCPYEGRSPRIKEGRGTFLMDLKQRWQWKMTVSSTSTSSGTMFVTNE